MALPSNIQSETLTVNDSKLVSGCYMLLHGRNGVIISRIETQRHMPRDRNHGVEERSGQKPWTRIPTNAVLSALRAETRQLITIIQKLKGLSPEAAADHLKSISINDEGRVVNHPLSMLTPLSSEEQPGATHQNDNESNDTFSDGDLDTSPFISVNEYGTIDSFGPSSALQVSTKLPAHSNSMNLENIRNSLIANAVLKRQGEYELYSFPDLDGVATDLGMHLLELHWNRQHHTFLLTYRPAIMRDLRQDGPFSSKFLLNAIFACSSKFSRRLEVRDDPEDPTTAGGRFFRRCDDLLSQESLLMEPSMPTVVGLLLLGSTFNARGNTSKGWLYTGYALRMVYDLGLHLDRKVTEENAEDIEIRRRVFWGAFICDKLQSLYLGRPVGIQLRDAHVSYELIDTMEEKETWIPYLDLMAPGGVTPSAFARGTPIYSVTCFQQLCRLSIIMTKIINKFYVIGATAASARANVQAYDDALVKWNTDLPTELRYDPLAEVVPSSRLPAPTVMNLHGIYHALIILLHRPLIADGHLRSAAGILPSWQRCTRAAANITKIALAYQTAYTLRGAPYLLSYALYVACTIHVRNAAALQAGHRREHLTLLASSLACLDELTVPNSGVSKVMGIIKKLMAAKDVQLPPDRDETAQVPRDAQDYSQDFGHQNLDAVLRTFSARSSQMQDISQNNSSTLVNWLDGQEEPFQDDLLYGFMGDYCPTNGELQGQAYPGVT
ncbi:uncharacterized protein BP5553_09780 [Venustampulla echinocandica]|uniref:Xylanolytic transcriptional activator regulatory domain-containing protein n=1 Tax=Venustampulla echinocandica TaxID=2656787 RepID=A0A370TAM6_9HELO|nr:uncharacterized protein BP5553_09780 [Venustampulla echinocandica]RDL30991.1 hypothetical protein BP5553_09780 [Venustampulla echinocandica]